MLSYFVILVTCILHNSPSKGELVQVSGKDAACYNDTAVFLCTNYNSGFLTWDIPPLYGSNLIVSINKYDHPEGTSIRYQIKSSPLVFTVISVNISFISATLTILNPIPLNGALIHCDNDFLQLNVTFNIGIVLETDSTRVKPFLINNSLSAQISIPVLVIIVITSVVGTFLITLFIGILLGLWCGVKYMQKQTNSEASICISQHNTMTSEQDSIYEEVKPKGNATITDYTQNIAYDQVKKAVF